MEGFLGSHPSCVHTIASGPLMIYPLLQNMVTVVSVVYMVVFGSLPNCSLGVVISILPFLTPFMAGHS